MFRRAFIPVFAASAVALAVACGSFDAAPPTDATADGGSADAGPTSDASPQLVRRCQGTLVRDETFDQPFNFAGWAVTPGAVISAVDAGPTPPALFAQVGVLGNVEVDNTLSDDLALAGQGKVCLELDVLYEATSGTFTNNSYGELVQVRAAADAALFLEMRAQGFALVQGTNVDVVPGFVANAWQHLVVRIPYGTGGQPSAMVDGFEAAVAPNAAGAVPQTIRVRLGLAAAGRDGMTAAARVHIDNFRVTTEP